MSILTTEGDGGHEKCRHVHPGHRAARGKAKPWGMIGQMRVHLCGVLPGDECRTQFHCPPRLYLHGRWGTVFVELPLPYVDVDFACGCEYRRWNWPPAVHHYSFAAGE